MAYYFASALEVAILDRKRHTREAERLRSLAPTLTTAAMRARVLEQAQEHTRLAGRTAEAGDPAPA
jgi:hypothetical protein